MPKKPKIKKSLSSFKIFIFFIKRYEKKLKIEINMIMKVIKPKRINIARIKTS